MTQTENAIAILMKAIEAQFGLHPKHNQDTRRHPDSQAGDIDARMQLVADDASPCDGDVVA